MLTDITTAYLIFLLLVTGNHLTDIRRSLSFQSVTRNTNTTLASNVLDLAESNRNSLWSNIPFSHNISAYDIRTENSDLTTNFEVHSFIFRNLLVIRHVHLSLSREQRRTKLCRKLVRYVLSRSFMSPTTFLLMASYVADESK